MHGKELSQDHLKVPFNDLFSSDDLPVAGHEVLDIELFKPRNALREEGAVASREVRPSNTQIENRVTRQEHSLVLPIETYGPGRVAGGREHTEAFFSKHERSFVQEKIKRAPRHLAAAHHKEVFSFVPEVFKFTAADGLYDLGIKASHGLHVVRVPVSAYDKLTCLKNDALP